MKTNFHFISLKGIYSYDFQLKKSNLIWKMEMNLTEIFSFEVRPKSYTEDFKIFYFVAKNEEK